MKFTNLMRAIDKYGLNGTQLVFYWDGDCIIKGVNGTGAFESDNGLEMDDKNYQEYYACGIKIIEIISKADTAFCTDAQEALNDGEMVEISEFNEPQKIETVDGQLLWSREDNKEV